MGGRRVHRIRDEYRGCAAEGAIEPSDQYSKQWDIEIEYRMTKTLLPSIQSKDYRIRFFMFAYCLLLYNMWRMVNHSPKTLVSEVYDEYGRGRTRSDWVRC